MRLRVFAAFVLGFAVGVLCLAAGLWRFGGLRITDWRLSTLHQPPPTVPLDLNGMMAEAKSVQGETPPAPPLTDYAQPAPPPAQSAPPTAQGTADRMTPEALGKPPHLAMPIAGIDPRKLTGNFQEMRDGRKHEALDIMAPRGTPILAAEEGNVAKLFKSKQGGLTVYQFDNSGQWCLYYAHLDHYATGLKEGTLLHKGEVLGYVGTSGDAPPNAPHLHFALFKLGPDKKWWSGTAVDPLPLLQ